MRVEGVLDGELVQAELVGQLVRAAPSIGAQRSTHTTVSASLEVVGHVGDGKPSASSTPLRYTRVIASPTRNYAVPARENGAVDPSH